MGRDRKEVDVAVLIKTRKALFEQLNRTIKNIEKTIKTKQNEIYYTTRIESLQNIWKKFEENHILIYDTENKDSTEYISSDLYDQTETLYVEYFVKCKEAIKALNSKETNLTNLPSASTPIQIQEKEEVKLKPIQIPIFDGNYKNWRTFHDLFSSLVHKKSNLSCVQKLHYLKSSITGEAERLLRPFTITSANYSKAWEFLQNRYNNKKVLVNTFLKTLFGLQTIKFESANALKNLLDQSEEVLHELTSLDLPTQHWDAILVHTLVQKLPIETHTLWEQQNGNNTDLPTYQQLKDFLVSRFRTLEAIQENQNSKQKIQVPFTTKNNNFLNSKSKCINVCIKCKQNHFIFKCPEFRKMPTNQKLEFVVKNNLCKNCLSNNHKIENCPSKQNCSYCNKKHNTLLHENLDQHSAPSTSQVTNFTARSSSRKNKKIILLTTAMVNTLDKNGNTVRLRALIDSGSQTSFITKNAYKKLKLPSTNTNTEISGLGKTQTAKVQYKTNICIQSLQTEFKTNIETLIIKEITGKTPSIRLNITNCQHLLKLKLADSEFFKPGPIDLLLGAEVYSQIVESKVIKGSKTTPTAQSTLLGWILFGPIICKTETKNMMARATIKQNQNRQPQKPKTVKNIRSKQINIRSNYYNNSHKSINKYNGDRKHKIKSIFQHKPESRKQFNKQKELQIRQNYFKNRKKLQSSAKLPASTTPSLPMPSSEKMKTLTASIISKFTSNDQKITLENVTWAELDLLGVPLNNGPNS